MTSPRTAGALIEQLRHVPLLRGLTDVQLVDLSRTARTHRFEADQIVFLQGDPGDCVHIILCGQVKVVTTSRAGHEAILAFLAEGESFGEMSLLDDLPRSATIQATMPTTTLSLRKIDFHKALRDAPDLSLRLLRALARRLRETGMLVQDAAFLDVGERLAKKLVAMATETAERNVTTPSATRASGPAIELRVTQQDLASMIGATRESVNKSLASFRSRGLLVVGRHRLSILDLDGLRGVVDRALD
jgi:CRP-like cAMP-binding protein